MVRARVLAVLLALTAAPAAAGEPDAAPVIAAERAFAKDGAAHGIKASFLKWSAPDGIVFGRDGPTNAWALYGAGPDRKPGDPTLAWWPLWAGISASGDLGFTTGPVDWDGKRAGYHYFTVWKKQPDGSWLWVYDGGGGGDGADLPGADAEPQTLAATSARSASADAAMAEVAAAEADLAEAARTDAPAAILAAMPDDGRIHEGRLPPAASPELRRAALRLRSPRIAYAALGGGASQAGDLAWTYGTAEWAEPQNAVQGHYVRVWQKRAEGWRLVFDQIVRRPPPPKPAPANG